MTTDVMVLPGEEVLLDFLMATGGVLVRDDSDSWSYTDSLEQVRLGRMGYTICETENPCGLLEKGFLVQLQDNPNVYGVSAVGEARFANHK